jgi:hypothetical protein
MMSETNPLALPGAWRRQFSARVTIPVLAVVGLTEARGLSFVRTGGHMKLSTFAFIGCVPWRLWPGALIANAPRKVGGFNFGNGSPKTRTHGPCVTNREYGQRV